MRTGATNRGSVLRIRTQMGELDFELEKLGVE
jgi:hypothetical protein